MVSMIISSKTNQPMPGITGWGRVDDNGDTLDGREVNWLPGQ